jgi:hypothetical protein
MNASMGVSVGGNNSSLSGANASVGMNNSRSSEKQTVLTSLTGDTVNITTEENTHIKGALVAAGATDDKGTFQDNNNLNLSTKTLTFENLANTKSSNSTGLGIGAGVNSQVDISSVSAQIATGTSYERTKTLATLGNGNINITDSANSDEMDRLNRDITNINKSLVKTSTGTSASGTLDTRLLSEDGRAQVAQDVKVASKITDTIQKIATLEDVKLTDFFSQTDKSVKLFTAQNKVLKNNPKLAAKLSDPSLAPEEKRAYQMELVHAMENQLGYKLIDDLKVISTDEKGQGGKEVKGFITIQNDTIYSNDKNQNSTLETIATLGQEIAVTMQKREGIDITTDREHHNDYQDAIAKDVVNDVAFTLNNNHYKPMAQTNNHVQPKSLEEYSQLQQNNAEFAGLDKEFGDNLTIFIHGTYASPKTVDPVFINAVSSTYRENINLFDWSGIDGTANGEGGENTTVARANAAERLNKFIKDYPFKEGEKLNIIMHSHGGNIGNAFTNLYKGDKKVDNMIYLGTPVRDDYPINYKVFDKKAKILNVYDSSDLVQRLGGIDDKGRSLASQKIKDNVKVKNIKVESPNYGTVLYPTSIFNLKEQLLEDHSNLDTKNVWEQINGKK